MRGLSWTLSRRHFLATAGGAAVAALAAPARAADFLEYGHSPQQLEAPLSSFDRLITPNDDFFVRSHFRPPALRAQRALSIVGDVGRTVSLTPAELRELPSVTVTAVTVCAGSGRSLYSPRVPGVQWGHGAMGQAEWRGVRLADLLAKAGVGKAAAHVALIGADLPPLPTTPAFHRSIPLNRALDPTTVVAFEMNGAPIPLAHGGPTRLVVPGWAADNWTKWLTEIRPQKDEEPGFFMQKAYRMPDTPVKPGVAVPHDQMSPVHEFPVKSVIAQPAHGRSVPAGRCGVSGVAFSGHGAIERVQLSGDDGKTWVDASLEGEPGLGRWQVFRADVELARGTAVVTARATDAKGNVQPETPSWNPSGYFWNGWHRVSVEVA
ncbi:MAG: sulfite oxidase [Candidatus Binatia bacterium]|nr:sulfite oxidase [Candidatus Binatia bacterium]